MYKKSELYEMFIHELFAHKEARTNKNRLSIYDNEKRELIEACQQAAIESSAEILLEVLCKANVIEDDCTIDSAYRSKEIMRVAKDIVNYNT